jgi:DNA-binding response OmpR family regulator
MARTRRILVVEDQEQIADLIADALSDSYQPVCAQNVEAAVEQLLSGDIDLVLLDCVLPGGSMWQVMLEADRIGVPVVLMTGDPGQVAEVTGGPRPYILKPFSIEKLLDVVDAETGLTVAPAGVETTPTGPPGKRAST